MLGEPGIFGGFSFLKSELDNTPPKWYYVSLGTFTPGTNIVVMTTEDAMVYLVPDGTLPDATTIKTKAISFSAATAYKQTNLATSALNAGDYVVYAIDNSKNISEASKVIMLQYPVNTDQLSYNSEINVTLNQESQIIYVQKHQKISVKLTCTIFWVKKLGVKNVMGTRLNFKPMV